MVSEVLDYSWLALLFVNCGEAGHYSKGYGKENCSCQGSKEGDRKTRGEGRREEELGWRRGREGEESRVDDFMDSKKYALCIF